MRGETKVETIEAEMGFGKCHPIMPDGIAMPISKSGHLMQRR
jgi:hypothetical protein